LFREAPKEVRAYLSHAVSTTTVAIGQRMQATVPVDSGDLKRAIDWKLPRRNGLMGRVGVLDDPNQAAIALFNEYRPNRQAFMRPAMEAEAGAFASRCKRALEQVEAALSRGF
jgi:hypothetical protein